MRTGQRESISCPSDAAKMSAGSFLSDQFGSVSQALNVIVAGRELKRRVNLLDRHRVNRDETIVIDGHNTSGSIPNNLLAQALVRLGK